MPIGWGGGGGGHFSFFSDYSISSTIASIDYYPLLNYQYIACNPTHTRTHARTKNIAYPPPTHTHTHPKIIIYPATERQTLRFDLVSNVFNEFLFPVLLDIEPKLCEKLRVLN